MKLHLFFAGIALLVVVAPATAAETETERLEQAQGLFQPLPRDMATGRADYAAASRSRPAALLRSPTHGRRRSQLFQLPSASALRNGRAAQVDWRQAATASAPCPDNPQCRAQFHHSLARRPRQPRGSGDKGPRLADHERATGREGNHRPTRTNSELRPAVQSGFP